MAIALTVVEVMKRAAGMEINKRPCAECQACCTVIAERALGKPYYTSCTKLCPQGCSIYRRRPESCRTFECGWRMGLVAAIDGDDTASRPDKLGVLFDIDADQNGDWLEVYETKPGALQHLTIGIVMGVAQECGALLGVRYYEYGSEIGINFPAGADYPQGKSLEGRNRNYLGDGYNYRYTDGK